MIELYRLSGCPYCAKVADKLEELGLEYEQHNVMPFPFLRREVKRVSAQSGVPVLADPEHNIPGMAESDEIVAYLERTFGDSVRLSQVFGAMRIQYSRSNGFEYGISSDS